MRPSPVHPHARGERAILSDQICRRVGSSPRTWGTPLEPHTQLAVHRFIPTHVGNAPFRALRSPRSTVHPHARGERFAWVLVEEPVAGSSPRTWGTLQRGGRRNVAERFIPTHVGNAAPAASALRCTAVHPHARGERFRCWNGRTFFDGSSPRTWGTHGGLAGARRVGRFIPTHVGNAGFDATVADC